MKKQTENTKIILGTDGAKGYEIKKVLESWGGKDKEHITEVYISKDTYDFYINSNEREKESLIHGFSGEADEILEEMEALTDIDTQLFGLHCTLEYAENLPYDEMRETVQSAMKHINAMRANNRENTQAKLDEFKYKPHTSLLDNASSQLSEFYHVPYRDAKVAIEQALKEVETNPLYNENRDFATNKIHFSEVVKCAATILNPLSF